MAQTEVSPQHYAIGPIKCGIGRLFRGVFRKRLPWWIWAPVIVLALIPLAENWLHRFGIELLHPRTAALVRAIDSGDMAQVRALIDRGANVNAQVPNPLRENAVTPLFWAHQRNREEAVALLRAKKAHIAPASDREALPKAIYWNEPEEMRRLIRWGADLHPSDKSGLSLLHRAAGAQNLAAVKILVEAGLDVNAPALYGNAGATALHYASEPYYPKLDPDAPDVRGEIASFLLAHGANPQARDSSGQTPLGVARTRHCQVVEDALLNFKPTLKDARP